jgi:hypothetical protein
MHLGSAQIQVLERSFIEKSFEKHQLLLSSWPERARPKSMSQSRNGVIEVAVVEGIGKIPRGEWNALVSDDDSPFVDWDWLHAMEASKSAIRNTGWA